ncbi:MAG: hypothetical protein OHK0017_03060 [Patescibacteria group bacterium]
MFSIFEVDLRSTTIKLVVLVILVCGYSFNLRSEAEAVQEFDNKFENIDHLIISEINWDGSQLSPADEWLEIFNPTNGDIVINNYKIEGISNQIFEFNNDILYTVPARGSFLISNFEMGQKSDLAVPPDLASSSISLSNSILDIQLMQITDGETVVVDSTRVDGKPINPQSFKSNNQTKASLERNNDLSWGQSKISKNLNDANHLGTPMNSSLNFEEYPKPKIELPETEFAADQETEIKYSLYANQNVEIQSLVFSIYSEDCKTLLSQLESRLLPKLTPQKYCLEIKLETLFKSLKHEFRYIFPIVIISLDQNTLSSKFNYIVLSEIMPYKNEYIELFNQGTEKINLNGLTISDLEGKVRKYTVQYDLFIEPKSFILIDLDSKLNLNDDSDTLVLSYTKAGKDVIFDKVTYPKNKDKRLSYQLFETEWSWQLPTPEAENRISQPLKQGGFGSDEKLDLSFLKNKLFITEIMPREKEFIELFNNTNEEINLDKLWIKDLSGKTGKFQMKSTLIKPKEYFIIYLPKNINLNDIGDGIVLEDDFGNEISKVIFPKSKNKNQSWQLISKKWYWQIPSPGERNRARNDQGNCTKLIVYGRTSKNIFQTNLGAVSISGIPTNKFLNSIFHARVCNFRKLKSGLNADSLISTSSIKPSNVVEVNDISTLPVNKPVKFSFNCSGLKKAKLKREGLSLRNFYGVKLDFSCFNNRIEGNGYTVESKNDTLIYVYEITNLTPKLNDIQINNNKSHFEFILNQIGIWLNLKFSELKTLLL